MKAGATTTPSDSTVGSGGFVKRMTGSGGDGDDVKFGESGEVHNYKGREGEGIGNLSRVAKGLQATEGK